MITKHTPRRRPTATDSVASSSSSSSYGTRNEEGTFSDWWVELIKSFGQSLSCTVPYPEDHEVSKRPTLDVYFPLINMMRQYSFKACLADALAAVTVSMVLLPQAIAYSTLAKLQPITVLLSAFYPLVLYTLFGASISLSVGPEASLCIILGVTIESERDVAPELVASLLALMVGVLCIFLSIMRLGFIDQILSGYLLTGFVLGISNLIMTEQLPGMLGLGPILVGDDSTLGKLITIFQHIPDSKWRVIIISVLNCIFLLIAKYAKRKWFSHNKVIRSIPEILILVVVMIAVSAGLRLNENYGVPIVGKFTNNVNSPSLPFVDRALLGRLLTPSLVILLVGYIECQTVTNSFALKGGILPSSNRELFAFGFINTVGSFFGTMPIFASLPRSKILAGLGPKSTLANAMIGLIVFTFSQTLTPVLQYLPRATLSSIVFVAAIGLIEVKEIKFAMAQRSWSEIAMLFVTWLITFLTPIANGLLFCLGFSAILIIRNTTKSPMIIMGRAPHQRPLSAVTDSEAIEYGGSMHREPDPPFLVASQPDPRAVDFASSTTPLTSHLIDSTATGYRAGDDSKMSHPTSLFIDAIEHQEAELLDGVLLLRLEGPLLFYNVGQFRSTLEAMMKLDATVLSTRELAMSKAFRNEQGQENIELEMGREGESVGRHETVRRRRITSMHGAHMDAIKRVASEGDDSEALGSVGRLHLNFEVFARFLRRRALNRHQRRKQQQQLELEGDEKERMEDDGFHIIVLDLKHCIQLDSAATLTLKKVIYSYASQGIEFYLCGLHDFHVTRFKRAHMEDILKGKTYTDISAAVVAIEKTLDFVVWH